MMLNIGAKLNALGAMTACGLAPSLARTHTVEQLMACCDAVQKSGLDFGQYRGCDAVQERLVKEPKFSERLSKLLQLGLSGHDINSWLETESETGCRIEDYSDQEIAALINLNFHSMKVRHIYAMLFMRKYADDVIREVIIANMNRFYYHFDRSSAVGEKEQALFTHAFLRDYMDCANTAGVFLRLAENEHLIALLDFLYAKEVDFCPEDGDMGKLYGMTEGEAGKLRRLFTVLGDAASRMEKFIPIWLDNGAAEEDIDVFLAKAGRMTEEQQDAALETQLSYLNTLYGGSIGQLPFDEIRDAAFDMMAYAITHRQNTFLRMIEANFDVFRKLPENSMLFERSFYTRIQLNSITAKNLKECVSGYTVSHYENYLNQLDRRMYTFDELKTLCNAPVQYIALYNELDISRTDDRLLVLRQLLKRDLLDSDVHGSLITELAKRLSERPFVAWKEELSAGIKGMTPRLCVKVLCRYESVKRFLPELSNASAVSFLLRHADALEDYESWAQVRADIEQIDTDWVKLKDQLKLDDAFVREHEADILDFLYQDGASIALTYASASKNTEGFYRILRALLMGKYAELKYHADDLQREIGFAVSDVQKQRWIENNSLEQGRIVVEERDDFFSTIRIGEIPQRTCLNYRDGAYRECLLACFDSNKKLLYATVNGKPAARAMLRLTKGREKTEKEETVASLEFADLTHPETASQSRPVKRRSQEELVVFLEHAYVSGVDPTTAETIKRMFITLAMQKAEELGARIVLASEYRSCSAQMHFVAMNYHLYISKSKAGIQYLDSLGGSCGVSSEGSYKQNLFMLLPE